MSAIEVKNVTMKFKNVTALNNISLTFEAGKLYGLLGRNGAGKSTLLNVISNRLFPDEGSVFLDGILTKENDEAQHKMYLMSEVDMYPKNFKVKDVFYYTQQFYGNFDMEYALKLCDIFSLDVKKKITTLSTGYASIYKLINALSVNVPYVFFDEPILGLDANHRDVFYKVLLERYADTQNTYVISTHLIDEIANLIEDIVIMKDGEIIQAESCEKLLKKGFTVTGKASSIDAFVQGKQLIGCDTLGGLKTAYILANELPRELPEDIEISKLDLQRLFIQLTNHQKENVL